MDDVTKAKIQIYSKRSQWEPALLELIDADHLPVRYGGTAPDLTPEECIATLDPPYVAVAGEGEEEVGLQVGVQAEEVKVSVCEEYTTTTTSASTSTNSTATAAACASVTTTTTAV